MSYILKIDNANWPGAEKMENPADALLLPQNIQLATPIAPPSAPQGLTLIMMKLPMPQNAIATEAKESGAELITGGVPNGTYGRTITMPVLKLKTTESLDQPNGTYGRRIIMPVLKLKTTEADSASSVGNPILRTTRESSIPLPFSSKAMKRFMEAASVSAPVRYLCTLICEGLGNFGDGFYYTAEALQSGAPKFEGQKCYANHPSSAEEVTLPERSVRDIVGHFENVRCVMNGDHAELQGELIVMGGPSSQWVVDQMDHALNFSQKYTDKDFVGLSINAGGQARPMDIGTFMSTQNIPESCKPKLETAMSEGLTQVKVVDQITEAISCDLVTQAGAGGRIIQKL